MITIGSLGFSIWTGSFLLGLFSFLVTFFMTPYLIKVMKKVGITGKDMNKKGKPKVAEMGGFAIIIGFCASLLPAIAASRGELLISLLGVLSTVLIIALIGVLDDILGWKKGIRQWQHVLIPIIASFPLIAVRAGHYTMSIPLLGPINFGLIYPILLIPIGITGAVNAVNMLGGMNGLRSGLCFLISLFLGITGLIVGNVILATLSFALSGTILAFLYFNWYPAKIFPGDTGTMAMGAVIASLVIVSNAEKIGVFLFFLFFVEFLLKARSKFQAENWGKVQKDGTLKPRYKKVYSLTQGIMILGEKINKRFTEKQVTLIILGMQFLIGVLIIFINYGWII